MSTHCERKVIIVGKTGNGKSSLGNTLLGRKAFLASDDFNAVTRECQLEENIGEITVVDTPGLFDTMETNGNYRKITSNALSILQSLDRCSKPHAFLFTLNGANRLTDEELSVIDVLKLIFGKEWANHVIVVVTHIENDVKELTFKTKWENCKQLKKFVEECNGRICRIDSTHPNEDHIKRILQSVTQVSQNGMRPFSNEYSDCRKKVLQNVEKLEAYNGMPTHLIVRDIGRNIEKSILEEIHRQKAKEIEEKKSKRNKDIKEAVMSITTRFTFVATSTVARSVGPVHGAVVGAILACATFAINVGCDLVFRDRG